jgi:hypothetical protein
MTTRTVGKADMQCLYLHFLLRCTLVANGTKRHFFATQQTVAFGGKADMGQIAQSDANDP